MKNEIEKWKDKNNMTWEELADRLEVTRQCLYKTVRRATPNITLRTVLKIREVTGLEPHQYIKGLDNLNKLINKTYEKPNTKTKGVG